MLNPIKVLSMIITPVFIKGNKSEAQELTKFIDTGMCVYVHECKCVLCVSKALCLQIGTVFLVY